MAFTKLVMIHPKTKELKEAPVGFSWTALFFGPFVPLFRGQYFTAILWLCLCVIITIFAFIIMACVYNKLYLKHLIYKGFVLKMSPMSLDIVQARTGIVIPEYEEEANGK